MIPLGAMEAVQKVPEYATTCEVTSMTCEFIRLRTDIFIKQVVSSAQTWNLLVKMTEEQSDILTKRIVSMNKIRGQVKSKLSATSGNSNADWMYCPYNMLETQKAQYDQFIAEQKLLNAVVNKRDPFTGELFEQNEGSTATQDFADA